MYINYGVFVANKIIEEFFDVLMPLCGDEINSRDTQMPYKGSNPFSIPSMQAHDELLEDGYALDEARVWAPHIASIATWALDPYVVLFDQDLAGLLSWHRRDLHMDSNVLRTPVKHGNKKVRCYYLSHTFKTKEATYSGAFMRVDYNPHNKKWCQVFTFLSTTAQLLSISFPLVNGRSIKDCIYLEAKPEKKKELKRNGMEDVIESAIQMRLYSIHEPIKGATTTPPLLYDRNQMINTEPNNSLPPGSTLRYAVTGNETGNFLRLSNKGDACIPYVGDPNKGNWIPKPIKGIDMASGFGATWPEWSYFTK